MAGSRKLVQVGAALLWNNSMSRLLFFAAFIAVVYLVLKSFRGRPAVRGTPEREEDMVRCAHCGVHLPRSESLTAEGKHYCSEAHRSASQPPSNGRDAG